MEGVPDALLESARIDGAGEVRILWRIVMPIVRPAWLTLLILMIQNLWNINSGYIFSEQLKTLTTALNQIVAGGIARAGTAGAASVIMMLVPMLVFVFTQSNVIETMGSSGDEGLGGVTVKRIVCSLLCAAALLSCTFSVSAAPYRSYLFESRNRYRA